MGGYPGESEGKTDDSRLEKKKKKKLTSAQNPTNQSLTQINLKMVPLKAKMSLKSAFALLLTTHVSADYISFDLYVGDTCAVSHSAFVLVLSPR